MEKRPRWGRLRLRVHAGQFNNTFFRLQSWRATDLHSDVKGMSVEGGDAHLGEIGEGALVESEDGEAGHAARVAGDQSS
jgi:hypothetical protein